MKHFAGHYYHVFNRGVNRNRIFHCEENYRFLCQRMQEYLLPAKLLIIAYCLMPNHYHMLLYAIEDEAVAVFLRRLFSSYTQAFNTRYARSGPLFDGRARTRLIDNDDYQFSLVHYIHLNPVRAGLVVRPEEWQHSNYPEFIGKRHGNLFDAEFVREQFGTAEAYREFVEAEIFQEEPCEG